MRCSFITLSLAALLTQAVHAQPGIHPDELKIKPQVDAAINKGVQLLIKTQLRDGTWGRYGNYEGGKAALCTYALLKCGVATNHPTIRRAFLYLENIKPHQTYTAACMMLAYAASDRPEHQVLLKDLARLMLSWQRGGDYGYPHPHNGGNGWSRADLSNTQYAALGLWVAQKHGIKIPNKIWRDLTSATLRYREKPKFINIKRAGKHTVTAGKVEIAGFGYTPRGKPTGSMTTAGIGVLQICKIGMGEKIPGVFRRKIDNAVESGIEWLGHHFSASKNPFKNSWNYYYLYGIERVGSLTRVEKMGKHWWYLAGARHLLKKQNKDGSWERGANREVQTSFSLLFLRRATRYAAVTGGSTIGKGADTRHLFSAGTAKKSTMVLNAAGQQPLAIWVKTFGDQVKAQHKQFGIRVIRVDYLKGKRILGQVAGKPEKAWKFDAFMYRIPALPRGTHQLHARVTLVAPDVPPGKTTPTVTIKSPVMPVMIRDIMSEWMEAAADLSSINRIRGIKVRGSASSHPKNAIKAADLREGTHWACDAKDKNPKISLELSKSVTTQNIVFTQAGSRVTDLGKFSKIKTIEILINKSKKGLMVKLNPDPLAVTTFKLPRTRKIRTLDIRIIERHPANKPAGFAEIGLTK